VLLRTALLLIADLLLTLVVASVHGGSCIVVDVLEGTMSHFEERSADAFLITILLDTSLSLFDSLAGVVLDGRYTSRSLIPFLELRALHAQHPSRNMPTACRCCCV
jgi:hypothetical protein